MDVKPEKIDLRKIRLDGETQSRVSINEQVVADYAEAISEGQKFTPVEVYHDGSDYWLADGFHRVLAFGKAGKDKIEAIVRKGTRSEAQWHGLGANKAHGLQRTVKDKEKSALKALRIRPDLSDNALAQHVGVSNHFIKKNRQKMEQAGGASISKSELSESGTVPNSDNSDIDICGSDKKTSGKIPEKRTCTDGRKYPARQIKKPAEKPKPKIYFNDPPKPSKLNSKHGKQENKPSNPTPVDQEGNPLPNRQSIREAFERRDEITEMMSAVSRLKSKVLKAAENEDQLFAALTVSQFQADCGNLRRALRAIRPHAVCPYCKGTGKDCKGCEGRGWVGEFVYEHAPADMKGESK